MGAQDGIKLEILNKYDDMTSVERSIADFFVKNEDVMDFSSRSISKALYTSEATLSRFAKKCDYKGYREFIFAYENELRKDINENNVSVLTKKVRNTYTQILDRSFQNLDEEQIKRVAGLMSDHSRVIIIGVGSSGYAAREFELRFMRLGMDIQAVTDSQMIPMTIALCDENSLVVAISLSGSTREVLDAVRLARIKNAAVIMITSNKSTEVASVCDELIEVASVKKLDEGTMISPQFPILIFIDIFYTYYFEHDAQRKALNYRKTLLALRGNPPDADDT